MEPGVALISFLCFNYISKSPASASDTTNSTISSRACGILTFVIIFRIVLAAVFQKFGVDIGSFLD